MGTLTPDHTPLEFDQETGHAPSQVEEQEGPPAVTQRGFSWNRVVETADEYLQRAKAFEVLHEFRLQITRDLLLPPGLITRLVFEAGVIDALRDPEIGLSGFQFAPLCLREALVSAVRRWQQTYRDQFDSDHAVHSAAFTVVFYRLLVRLRDDDPSPVPGCDGFRFCEIAEATGCPNSLPLPQETPVDAYFHRSRIADTLATLFTPLPTSMQKRELRDKMIAHLAADDFDSAVVQGNAPSSAPILEAARVYFKGVSARTHFQNLKQWYDELSTRQLVNMPGMEDIIFTDPTMTSWLRDFTRMRWQPELWISGFWVVVGEIWRVA